MTTEGDFILTTATHNYISRKAELKNSQQIELRGRSVIQNKALLQGDVAPIRVGRFTHIQQETTITPPSIASGQHAPVSIGAHTYIGSNVQSKAAAIGSFCWIGDSVQLGERVILKDAVIVQDGVSIPADTVVPPFTLMKENGEWHELPPAITVELQERSKQYYHDFASAQKQ